MDTCNNTIYTRKGLM